MLPGIKSRSRDDRSGASVLPFSSTGNPRGNAASGGTTFMEMDGPIEVRKTIERISDYHADDKMERADSRENAGEFSGRPV